MSTALKLPLDTMSYRDLQGLSINIADALKRAKAREQARVREQLERVAGDHGFKLSELLPVKRRTFKPTSEVKIHNPDDPSQTWSGRGRRPHWLTPEKLAQFKEHQSHSA